MSARLTKDSAAKIAQLFSIICKSKDVGTIIKGGR